MKLRINVEGKTYEVVVEILEEDRPHNIAMPTAAQGASDAPITVSVPASAPHIVSKAASTANESKVLRSPISGVVIRVPIQTGQKVSASDALMVLEAMKMETVIASHCDGKISAIHARAGDAVQVEQVLIEFE